MDSLVNTLRLTGLAPATLGAMLRNDLFPTLYPNLLSVAGNWDAFDEDWLLNQLQRRRSQRRGCLQGAIDWAAWQTVGRMVWGVWTKVKCGLQAQR
ncbi:uncharacterized protein LAESUDRAFT_724881 [Laetiporus sulphureus 93-53]|uniref:DUF7079 domain-containing protein n=1 Tax=Laetiporus sulphureus 93-53 TaxID=1314785 RepID=A0A165EN69_9APHY|nr:uncharacterized protein LAESUDRAFT_724881 [Laetiporus sulphureus 93-53]KZT07413.1 hypothetical protein LAESUDRAFT_724881 [Laetiporus sulphureus 93-53]